MEKTGIKTRLSKYQNKSPMKKSTFYILLYFAIITAIALLTSCSSTQHGYDYKTHHRKAHNAKPSKCYKTHNKW